MKHTSHIFLFILCLAASISHAQLPSYLPPNGLVAWYPFNGNANDESGNGNDGVVDGASLTNDRFGNQSAAYSFNGISDCISGACSQFPTSDRTISFWFKSNLPDSQSWFFGYGGENCGSSCVIYANSDQCSVTSLPRIMYSGHCCNQSFNVPFNNNGNSWQNLVITSHDDSKVYLNGEEIYSGISLAEVFTLSKVFYLGAAADPAGTSVWGYYQGELDDICIYNRALSAAEVTALYTTTATNTGGGTTSTSPAPPGIPYQAEVRNEGGEILPNSNVNVRFTLHELTANGTVSYQETHAITTNELGLFAATIGAGTATQGTFTGINWAQTTKFLQVEVDAGNGYITMGNQQLMSVPYALYAANSQPGPQGAAGPQGPEGAEGQPGANGLSAYEVWLAQGNSGSESDFLQMLSNNSSPSNLGFTVFTQSGTFTVPQGVTEILVEAWGGGGGGGGTCAQSTARYGGGGGAGAYIKTRVSVTPLETYTVNVGQGGQGGQGVPFQVYGIGSNGQNGTPTCMGNIVCAAGGNGGAGGNCDFGTGAGIVGAGGQGGSCSAGAMICNPGAPGSSGTTTQPGSGGSGHNQFINGIYNIGAGGSAQQPGQQGAIIIQY